MSSVIDPLDTPHSDSDSERTLTASFPDYGDSTSACSPDANLLVGTRRTATLATDDELFYAALQRSSGATVLTGTRFRHVDEWGPRTRSVEIPHRGFQTRQGFRYV